MDELLPAVLGWGLVGWMDELLPAVLGWVSFGRRDGWVSYCLPF